MEFFDFRPKPSGYKYPPSGSEKRRMILKKRFRKYDQMLFKHAKKIMKDADLKFPPKWRVVCTTRSGGICHRGIRIIEIPIWVVDGKESRLIYYIAHELAHIPYNCSGHKQDFMNQFAMLCPPEHQHYEYGYKPREAKKAGIATYRR